MKTIKCNVYNYPGLKPLIVANYKKGEMATFLDMDKDVPYGFHTVVLRIEDHAGSNNIRYAELVEVVGDVGSSVYMGKTIDAVWAAFRYDGSPFKRKLKADMKSYMSTTT